MSLTIPFCLGMEDGAIQDSDPAVRWRGNDGFEASWHPGDSSERNWPEDDYRLLVEQSAPTLERVLARHLGWSGNHRPVMRLERRGHSNTRPVWVLRNLTKWHDAPVLDDGPNFYAELPAHISVDLDRLEALAEAVVWYARAERARKVFESCDFPEDHEVTGHPGPPSPDYIEKNFDLTTWAVQR